MTISYGKRQLVDGYGWGVENTPMEELRVVTPIRIVGTSFSGSTVDSNFWSSTVTTGSSLATVVSGSATMIITTGSALDSRAIVTSVRTARYVAGSASRFRSQIQFGDSGTAGNTRRWGAFTTSNGCFYELAGTSLKIVTRKNGVDTPVLSTAWNGDSQDITLTSTNEYEIYWTNTKVYFSINGIMRHTVDATVTDWTDERNLPVRLEHVNSAIVASGLTMKIRVASIYRLGELTTETQYKNITTGGTNVLKYSPGRLDKIIVNFPTSGSITIYDNTNGAGTTIGLINSGALTQPFYLDYGVPFNTGLTIVTSASPNITVVYE